MIAVGTNEVIKQHVEALLALGLPQTVVADAMGVSPSYLNRWLHGAGKTPRSVGVDAMDGYRAFLAQLRVAARDPETAAPTSATADWIDEVPELEAKTRSGAPIDAAKRGRTRGGGSKSRRGRRRSSAARKTGT